MRFWASLRRRTPAARARFKCKIGDARVFDGVISGRSACRSTGFAGVRRGLAQGRPLETDPDRGGRTPFSQVGVLLALERGRRRGRQGAGARTGGRSPASPRRRAQRRAKSPTVSSNRRPRAPWRASIADHQALLRRFLDISGHPDAGSAGAAELADDAKLDIGRGDGSFDERVGFLAARGLDINDFNYSAAFVRDLDYYTGFVFEAVDRAVPRAAGDRRRPL